MPHAIWWQMVGVFMIIPGGRHLTGRRSVLGAKAPSQTHTACNSWLLTLHWFTYNFTKVSSWGSRARCILRLYTFLDISTSVTLSLTICYCTNILYTFYYILYIPFINTIYFFAILNHHHHIYEDWYDDNVWQNPNPNPYNNVTGRNTIIPVPAVTDIKLPHQAVTWSSFLGNPMSTGPYATSTSVWNKVDRYK